MCSYLKNRKQKSVVNNGTSTTGIVIAGDPLDSIDWVMLFNLLSVIYPICGRKRLPCLDQNKKKLIYIAKWQNLNSVTTC